ncbi:MAG: hypothetical protein WD981_02565 [Gaiellaceae bacterium]
MKDLLRRPLFAFAFGVAITAAALLGHAAYATDGAIDACFKPSNGTLYLLGNGSGRTVCQPGDVPISWNAAGLNGQDGEDGQDGQSVTSEQLAPGEDANCPNGGSKFTSASGVTYACNGSDGQDGEDGHDFAGTFASSNGLYRLRVEDDGIRLEGPNGRASLVDTGITLDSALALTLRAGTAMSLRAAGPLTVNGTQITLNGPTCMPAARIGDGVAVNPASGIGAITAGSLTVCIGG